RRPGTRRQAKANLREGPHAGEKGGRQVSEVTRGGGANQEVGVGPGGWRHRRRLQVRSSDPELGGQGAVQVHLCARRGKQQVGEPGQRLEVRRPGGGQSQQAAVLDQKAVVLQDPEAELLGGQAAI